MWTLSGRKTVLPTNVNSWVLSGFLRISSVLVSKFKLYLYNFESTTYTWKTLARPTHFTKRWGLAHKTNSTSPLFIEVPVPSQDSERSSICVLEVSILSISMLFLQDIRTFSIVWRFFVFHFISPLWGVSKYTKQCVCWWRIQNIYQRQKKEVISMKCITGHTEYTNTRRSKIIGWQNEIKCMKYFVPQGWINQVSQNEWVISIDRFICCRLTLIEQYSFYNHEMNKEIVRRQ